MPAAAWPATGAEDGPAGGRAGEQSPTDGGERKQRYDQTGREPDSTTQNAARARRGLMLFDDFGFALLATLDDGGVIRVDQAGVPVKVLHELIVGLGVVDAVVYPNVCQQRVDRHGVLLPPTMSRPRLSGAPRFPSAAERYTFAQETLQTRPNVLVAHNFRWSGFARNAPR
jgi:hypothetical protein